MWNKGKILYMLMILCAVTSQGCTTSKKASIASQAQPLITLEKTACLGKCPSYLLSVYERGSVVFEPKKHTLIDTIAEYTIDPQQLVALRTSFEENFPDLDSNYLTPIMDAPMTYLQFRSGETTKKISRRGPAPSSFLLLVDQVERLAGDAGWLPKKTDDGRDKVEIIIELFPNTTPEAFLNDLSEYEPALIKQIIPSRSYYLFSIIAGNPHETMKEIRANPLVKTAQWNHELKKRER